MMSLALARRLDHVSFLVHDLDAALRFYCDVLGCRATDRPDLGFPGAWLSVGSSGMIHLVTSEAEDLDLGRPPGQPTGFANHVAVSTDSVAHAREVLTGLGLEVGDGVGGLPQIFVQDPSGNVIELIERP